MRLSRVLLLTVLSLGAAAGQTTQATGAIQGVVLDSSKAALPGVRVIAILAAAGATRETSTSDTGAFQFRGLVPGDYTLRLERDGFAPLSVEAFAVSVGQTVVQSFVMQPSQLVERVEVKERPEALDPAATTQSVTLGGDRIEEAPAQNRNYLNFVLVAPGVASASGSSAQRSAVAARSAAADSGFTFAGMRARSNSISIDGVDNRDETTGGNRVAIGLEMVQEFRVSGTSVGAEFGGAAGGAVNVVTRSGANIWHGDWTFFTQNELLNARNPEVDAAARPRFRRYQPGTSIMGPVRRDRTFFAFAVEQESESSQEWSEAGRSAPAITAALAGAPFAGAGVRSVSQSVFPSDSSETELSFKANHQVGEKHSLAGRYAFSRGRIAREVLGADNFSDVSGRGSSLTRDHSFVGGWVYVAGPALVNDIRVQVARRSVDMSPNAPGAMLEIPGVLTMGQGWRLDSARSEDHYELVENVSASLGRHQLSFGADAHTVRLDARLANRFGGAFLFPTLEAFLSGRPDVWFQAFGDPGTVMRTLPFGAWMQDRWQLTHLLNLEAGVRYDFQRMPGRLPGANHNAAPRLGLAYRPSSASRYVFRAGVGLFYDRYPLAFLNDAIQKDGVHGFEQYAAGGDAVRAFDAARGGTLAAPLAGLPLLAYTASRRFPSTYSRKLTAGMERSLGKDTRLTLEYTWLRGLHLPRIRNIDGGLPPRFELEQTARSSYQGASISLNRRMSRELTFLLAYSAGSTHDDGSDFDEQPLDPLNTRKDWALSRQHQAHRVAASALFDLPVDDLPRRLREPLEKITLAPIFTYGSGRPLNALESSDVFRTGAYPITARPFGMERNPYLTPATASIDMRVMKTIPVKHDRMLLQFGAEGFNLSNRFNPLRISPYFAGAGSRLSSYREPVEMLNPRQVQLMVQLEY